MAGSMERWIGKVAVVTGASAGIGYAISEKLVDEGVTVVAVARRKAKLEELVENLKGRKGKILTFEADVSIEQDILNLFKWIKENVGAVHILVNNAGCVRLTNLTEGNTKMWREVFDVQVMGLCIATREAVQDMRANKVDGHIVHINSTDGHKIINFPNVNVFAASKYAVTALTETLRNELNLFKDKIKVSSVSPGFVKTDIMKSGCAASGEPSGTEFLPEDMLSNPVLNPEDVANAVIFVLSTPPHVQIHELIIQAVGEPY